MAGGAIVPRATVAHICAHRARALALWEEAFTALQAANDKLTEAKKAMHAAAPTSSAYTRHSDEAKAVFLEGIRLPDADDFMRKARHLTDIDVWSHVIEITDLERLMDKKAKDELRQSLMKEPPEATEDNIFATLETFARDADMIFKRGVAECFSNLDRRFRSHDGWKIGSRVILDRAFDESGFWSYHSNHRDTLMDIERAFFVLDGLPPPPNYYGIVGAVENARRGGWGARQTEVQTEFFTLRVFKNGNAHLWFKRSDLLEKVNQVLGDYYGAPIPEEREAEDDGGLFSPKTTPAKNHGFYPTPDPAADFVMREVPILQLADKPPLTILEPSAGTGNLARRCVRTLDHMLRTSSYRRDDLEKNYRFDNQVDCVEIQPALADRLKAEGVYRRVINADFLALKPDPANLYDRIVMNPPFDRERDIDHVMHALKFLKPEGFLMAIMSAGTEFRETRKARAFRELMAKKKARWSDLPARSFSEVGTNCNTIMIRLWNNGREFY